MEDAGLIYREQAEDDSRKVLVFLTEEGVRMRKLTKETIANFNEKVKKKISVTKLKHFYEVMNVIDELAEEELKNEKKLKK